MIPVWIFSLVVAVCITLPTVLCWRWWDRCRMMNIMLDDQQVRINNLLHSQECDRSEIRHLTDLIGKPAGVVWLPETVDGSYWQDHRRLSEQNRNLRDRLREEGQRLGAIRKLLETDGCSGTYINPICSVIDMEKP